jgi:hypothetical protein
VDDASLARILVEHGLAASSQVEECLRHLRELSAAGVSPLPGLAELMVRRGYLTPAQLDRTVRLVAPPAPAPESGEKVGRYRKSSKIGEGGMGEVWKAWDQELRRWVALKFLKTRDAGELIRFQREAQTAAQLAHPNIAAVYECRDGYLAMQFIDGQTLATVPRIDVRKLAG